MNFLKLIVIGIAVVELAPVAGAYDTHGRTHILPGRTAFPESIGTDQRTGTFFTGSLIDGTVYRGSLDRPAAEVFLPAGSDERSNVAGVKVDRDGRVWVADAFNGRVLVYAQTGRLLHTFLLTGRGTPTVNDIAFTKGLAYITDSARPFLYRIQLNAARDPGTTTVTPWLDVSSVVRYATGDGPLGVNLNGIVASADGRTLLAVQTNTGVLFRVDVAAGTIEKVAVEGAELSFGDGLLRRGRDLYVARNAANEIVKLKLRRGWRSATLDVRITSDQFAFPTALGALGSRLLVTNAQLNAVGSPQLPFTVVDLPLSGPRSDETR